jgi:2-polyprenyl-3-methyl-5-hydroxy-6-metoxy-1,4-benzoquinol methylase
MKPDRAQKEIIHGKILADNNPELIWGWESEAGKIRARRRAKLINAKTRLEPETKVLEIGCGTGIFTELFAETHANLIAVDISPELLNIASQKKYKYNNVSFINKSFEECGINGPFDAVIGSSILHHLEIDNALAKIFDLLKPGGVMCFAEPNMLNPQIFLQKNIPWLKRKLGDSPDETAFLRWQLKNLLKIKKFKNISITPFDWLHPATPPLFITPIMKLGVVLEKIPIVREFSGSLIIYAKRPLE